MGNKLKAYIKQLRSFLENTKELPDPEGFKQELLREIQFWQHERLVHLIVTFMFAIVTVAVLLVMNAYLNIEYSISHTTHKTYNNFHKHTFEV